MSKAEETAHYCSTTRNVRHFARFTQLVLGMLAETSHPHDPTSSRRHLQRSAQSAPRSAGSKAFRTEHRRDQ